MTTPSKNEVEQDSQGLQRQILYLKEENERLKRHADKLSYTVMDKEKKIATLQQYEYNLRKVNEQKVALESINRDHCERISTLISEKEQTRKVLEELNGIKNEKQEALDETAILYTQFDALKKIYADAQEQLDLYNEQLLAAEKEIVALQSQVGCLEACRKQLEAFEEKEVHYAKAQEELNEARKLLFENQRLHDDCRHAVAAQEDAEVRLRVAQQHLAKKVKETSELNDKLDGLEFRVQELQKDLDQIRTKSEEQQTSLEAQVQLERRLREQLQEAAKLTEVATAKWEEKYFKIYEKWQNSEIRLKELKKLEEKHAQMQALLTSFGSLVGTSVTSGPVAFPSIPASCLQSEINQPPLNHYLYEDGIDLKEHGNTDIPAYKDGKSYARPYQNLFDMPRQLKRPKETLFE